MKHSEEFEKLVDTKRREIIEINLEEAKKRLEQNPQAVLIDVREDNEWESEHAKGSVHLGRGVIERDIVQAVPDKDTELILYCGGGFRSVLAGANLKIMGYTKVHSLMGGFKAMKAAGYPMEKG